MNVPHVLRWASEICLPHWTLCRSEGNIVLFGLIVMTEYTIGND